MATPGYDVIFNRIMYDKKHIDVLRDFSLIPEN